MTPPAMTLPKPVAVQAMRTPQENIPPTKAQREFLLRSLRLFLAERELVPPIPIDELRQHTEAALNHAGIDLKYLDFAAVLLSNEIWRETLAAIPYERRLLLLPKCLRIESKCPAPFDEFGLLCKKCGLCSIQDLQVEAERLGYAVLVAEGSPIVMAIIETGKIDAIIGVSCLSVLERAFPHMEAAAIPGIALPLLQDDCKDTSIDLDWVWETIHLTNADRARRMDLTALREEVDSWFEPELLDRLMGPADGEAEQIARGWLGRAGKRWRPFLAVAASQALQADPCAEIPEALKKIAVAVECFHKASLIHDDIEDGDKERYGEPALHEEFGIPVALNAGDCLIGEGYRLLAECDAPAEIRAAMTLEAARGQRVLCQGQGRELLWTRSPKALSSLDVLDIFRLKTAPAFEVALRVGAHYAGASEDIHDALTRYSEALGAAYQIRDDMDDLTDEATGDLAALRPALPLAIAHERASGDQKEALAAVWRREPPAGMDAARLRAVLETLGASERCRELLEAYKEEAVRSLSGLNNATLKGLLRRVIGKIFNETEIKGWCHEFEARNAPGVEARAEPAA